MVWAKPRASLSAVLGVRTAPQGDALAVRLAAPPAEGAANAELLALLARVLRLPPRELELVQGASGRLKRVLIRGLRPEDVVARLSVGPSRS